MPSVLWAGFSLDNDNGDDVWESKDNCNQNDNDNDNHYHDHYHDDDNDNDNDNDDDNDDDNDNEDVFVRKRKEVGALVEKFEWENLIAPNLENDENSQQTLIKFDLSE